MNFYNVENHADSFSDNYRLFSSPKACLHVVVVALGLYVAFNDFSVPGRLRLKQFTRALCMMHTFIDE